MDVEFSFGLYCFTFHLLRHIVSAVPVARSDSYKLTTNAEISALFLSRREEFLFWPLPSFILIYGTPTSTRSLCDIFFCLSYLQISGLYSMFISVVTFHSSYCTAQHLLKLSESYSGQSDLKKLSLHSLQVKALTLNLLHH